MQSPYGHSYERQSGDHPAHNVPVLGEPGVLLRGVEEPPVLVVHQRVEPQALPQGKNNNIAPVSNKSATRRFLEITGEDNRTVFSDYTKLNIHSLIIIIIIIIIKRISGAPIYHARRECRANKAQFTRRILLFIVST